MMLKRYYTLKVKIFLFAWIAGNVFTLMCNWMVVYCGLLKSQTPVADLIKNGDGVAKWEWFSGINLYAYWLPYAIILYLGNVPEPAMVAMRPKSTYETHEVEAAVFLE